MAGPTNYPDVLGYISGGARFDYGVLQATAAVQPNPVKAGRPMNVTVILQNTTDSALEVLVVVTVPQRDLGGKSGAFLAKVQRLAIGMQACEVGVLSLPLITQPGTAPGLYRLPLQITAKATGKANRIRLAEGGGTFYMGAMNRNAQQAIEALRGLKYAHAPAKRGGLFGGGTPQLEALFTLEQGTLGGVIDRKADYQPLWNRRDLKEDPRLIMDRHRDSLINYVLPALDRTRMLVPFTNHTVARFKDAGYELKEVEASLIARVMVHILEYACTGQLSYGRTYLPRPEYEVLPTLNKLLKDRPQVKMNWFSELLGVLEEDPRAARFVSKFLPERCYDALLRDALAFSLIEVETISGLDLGSGEELDKFVDAWMEKFTGPGPIAFEDVYLPLIVAGIALHDDVIVPDENVKVMQTQIQRMLSNRKDERTEENAALFEMIRGVLDKAMRKYGLG